jgi:hypothetical protein
MAALCGSDEVIVGNIQFLPERLKAQNHFIAVGLWIDPSLLGRFLHLLAVFIRAGEEENVVSLEALEAGEDIRSHSGIRMANMRNIINIVDRGGDVKEFLRARMHEW